MHTLSSLDEYQDSSCVEGLLTSVVVVLNLARVGLRETWQNAKKMLMQELGAPLLLRRRGVGVSGEVARLGGFTFTFRLIPGPFTGVHDDIPSLFAYLHRLHKRCLATQQPREPLRFLRIPSLVFALRLGQRLFNFAPGQGVASGVAKPGRSRAEAAKV